MHLNWQGKPIRFSNKFLWTLIRWNFLFAKKLVVSLLVTLHFEQHFGIRYQITLSKAYILGEKNLKKSQSILLKVKRYLKYLYIRFWTPLFTKWMKQYENCSRYFLQEKSVKPLLFCVFTKKKWFWSQKTFVKITIFYVQNRYKEVKKLEIYCYAYFFVKSI